MPAAYTGMLPEVDSLATVVVCEDDEATLELLCDHLTADRYRALAAPSASDALRICHFKQPDLLLLDLMLPDASGLDVLREIRATDGSNGRFDPGLPVVVLSGRGAPADRVRGLAEGADDYVVKRTRSPDGSGSVRWHSCFSREAEATRADPGTVALHGKRKCQEAMIPPDRFVALMGVVPLIRRG